MDVDRGQLVGRGLKDVADVMDLHDLAPVSGRATSGRDGRRLEWFAEMCENLTSRGRSHPGLRPLANLRFEVSRLLPAVCSEPDVTTAVRALERKLLPHPGHEFRPRNPRRVVRAGLLFRLRVTAACGAMTVAPMPAGRGLALLANVADGQRRDGPPQLVIRRKHPVVAMPVLPRRRDELGEPVEELKRRELDDAVGVRPRGLTTAAGPDPVGGLVSGQHVANAGDPDVWAADHGDPLAHIYQQLAVSRKGEIKGNYYDSVSDAVQPVTGAIDRDTRKATWTVGAKGATFETTLDALLEPTSTASMRSGAGTQTWELVQMEKPAAPKP